jgi:AcrR family transcriptional regulator
MKTALEKARQDPESMKARILDAARRIFGEYGYHGTTTRMIAQEVGIDISTLHYHWGDKKDLYEAVVLDINKDLGQSLRNVEKMVHGRPLAERLAISIDTMTDFLFEHPEIPNLILLRYFGRTREEALQEIQVPEFVADIARSMNLIQDKRNASARPLLEVLAVMNGIYNYISGEAYFRSMTRLDREAYIAHVKEVLKFVLIPAFVQREGKGDPEKA